MPLLDSLEQRLDLLTRTLSAADIAEKSIDIVKEIKELHAILRSLRDDAPTEAEPRMVVVWGGPPSAASGRLPQASQKAGSKTGQTTESTASHAADNQPDGVNTRHNQSAQPVLPATL
ncbi:hypothetical protein [Desulfovibrio desulfuricans]|uniref:hypothetical protein n=1 Tax=Desulfovibrio desulfuricans TaxID=876 RepID=UPI0035B3DA70